jgi:hypothetical protein
MAFTVEKFYEVTGRGFSLDHTGKRQYTRIYFVETDNDDIEEPELLQRLVSSYGLPDLFDSKSVNDPGAVASNYRVEQLPDAPWVYIVNIDFNSHLGQPNPDEDDKDKPPYERRSKISYEGSSVQFAVTKDLTSPTPKILANSSDEPYKGYVVEVPCLTIRIEQFVAADRPAVYQTYYNAINNDVFQGYPVDSLRVCEVRASPAKLENFDVYLESWGIQYNPLGWKRYILDQGFRRKLGVVAGKQTYEEFRDKKSGKVLSSPTLLNGSGDQLGSTADPVYNEFYMNFRQSFNALGIPRG